MSIRKISALASVIGACALALSANAWASMATVSFDGGTFSLSGTSVSNTNCGGTDYCYDVTYQANFSGWTNTSATDFTALAFQPPGSITYVDQTFTGATTVQDNGLNSGGCASSSTGQWVCTTFDSSMATSGTYSYEYYIGLNSSGLDFSGSSLKMRFVDSSGGFVTLMSCTESECPGTTVPEPGTLALFAAGLLGCALFIARRRRARQS